MNKPPIATRQLLQQEYWQKFLELGHPPTVMEVNADPDMHSWTMYQRHFGSMKALLKKLGLGESYNRPRSDGHEYTKEYLLQKLREKYYRDGSVPTYNGVTSDWHMPSAEVYRRRFQRSWQEILQLADIRPVQSRRHHQGLNRQYLIEKLQHKARISCSTPTRREVDNDLTMPNSKTYSVYFGSYYQALLAANLTPTGAQTRSHHAMLTRRATS